MPLKSQEKSTEFRKEWGGSEYDKSRYQTRKNIMIQALDGKCVQCESTENLEFDHIDPETKSFSVMKLWNRSWDVLLPELEKCQLLCKECHKAKSIANQSVNHGEGLTGRKNCYCALCAPLKREYMKHYKR